MKGGGWSGRCRGRTWVVRNSILAQGKDRESGLGKVFLFEDYMTGYGRGDYGGEFRCVFINVAWPPP